MVFWCLFINAASADQTNPYRGKNRRLLSKQTISILNTIHPSIHFQSSSHLSLTNKVNAEIAPDKTMTPELGKKDIDTFGLE